MVDWLKAHPLIQLALAGACGTLARYWIGGLVQQKLGSGYPWGTLVINVSGCLLFGFVWTLAEDRLLISPQTRVVVLTGFMGAFTTFSTFAFETSQMLASTEWFRAVGNLGLQNLLGLAAVFLGMALGRLI
ncbi:MAG: fluoride efflux transporter CrcB [Planctomycetes bacterium]|nr:fluoride efflux transporter CrcB [Planctomycetota bacterium]